MTTLEPPAERRRAMRAGATPPVGGTPPADGAPVDGVSAANGVSAADEASTAGGAPVADEASTAGGAPVADGASTAGGARVADRASTADGASVVERGRVADGVSSRDGVSAANGGADLPSGPRVSMRERISYVIGDNRKKIGAIIGFSFVSAVCEAVTFVLIAQIAVSLVRSKKHQSSVRIIHLHINASLSTLLWVAFGLAVLRLLLQFPTSVLPAQLGSGIQAGLRLKLFRAFTSASWTVQSRDREGQLQETMSSQVMQATSGAMAATTIITTSLTFLILLGTAFLLNPVAAGFVLSGSIAMIGLLRPIRRYGVRTARRLSKAQVRYARAIAESIRVAEETHVFGVARVQLERVAGLIDASRRLAFRTQLIARLSSSLYQSLIYLLLIGVLAGLYVAGAGHAESTGAVVLLLVRAASYGQSVSGVYQGLAQSLPFIERVQDTAQRYESSRPPEGHVPLPRVGTLTFEHVSYAYRPGVPVLKDISFEMEGGQVVGIIGPVRGRQVDA